MVTFLRYCLCGLAFVSSLTFASDRVVIVEPSQLQKTYTPGQAPYLFNDSRSWAEPVSAQGKRLNVPVTTNRKFTPSSFKNVLKSGLKTNPAQLAITAVVTGLLAGVDWVMEEGVLIKNLPGGLATTIEGNSYYWKRYDGTTFPGSSTFTAANIDSACNGAATLYDNNSITYTVKPPVRWVASDVGSTPAYLCQVDLVYPESPTIVRANIYPRMMRYGSVCPSGTTLNTTDGQCYGANKAPASPSDIDALVDGQTFSSSDAVSLAPDLDNIPGSFDYPDGYDLTGPASIAGEPITSTTTTPTGTEVTTSTPSYSFDYSTNPLSITTTTTNSTTVYNNGTLVSTTNTTNAGTVNPVEPAKPPEQITDCEFMPTVCAFLDWFAEPSPPPEALDVPMIDSNDFEKSYSGPSLSVSCPAPFSVSTGFAGAITIPVQPLCDLAGLIRYLVLSAAGLLAAFIISGTRRA